MRFCQIRIEFEIEKLDFQLDLIGFDAKTLPSNELELVNFPVSVIFVHNLPVNIIKETLLEVFDDFKFKDAIVSVEVENQTGYLGFYNKEAVKLIWLMEEQWLIKGINYKIKAFDLHLKVNQKQLPDDNFDYLAPKIQETGVTDHNYLVPKIPEMSAGDRDCLAPKIQEIQIDRFSIISRETSTVISGKNKTHFKNSF